MSTPEPKHPGRVVQMGGKEWVIPPLNFKAVRELRPILASINGSFESDESINAVVKVVHTAMRRNYPDLKQEDVEDMIDLGNVGDVTEAVISVSGLVPKAMGAAAAAAPVAPVAP